MRSISVLILRLVKENPAWGYRRVHGERTTLGVKVAPSTVWEILKQEGIDPSPARASVIWPDFLRSQADALLALRLHRDHHLERAASVHPRCHRTRHQARSRAGHHRPLWFSRTRLTDVVHHRQATPNRPLVVGLVEVSRLVLFELTTLVGYCVTLALHLRVFT
ncbi:hypothetical protein ACIHFD_10970 [Nonomuraea sp. NPDC051941]|uniref:hypothetical protein n=1 Tax=Nonomuraea sp. NPDC051941 TaxID=3364373 RepID=UPI0037C93986